MDINKTLEYIHNVKWQGAKPGLERTRELLSALGNPERELKFVHIAGTNGKGSTATCIASVLQKAGYRTGLYTSPYILRFNERMQVDGEHISDEELITMTEEIKPHADKMTDSPTEFELITALAMKYFYKKHCDIVVLEVGMGGELDSTNVIEVPEVAVITTIGLDHVRELGPELCDIAAAKAGIIKTGGDVVVYGGVREVQTVFERVCAERGARLYNADFTRISNKELSLSGMSFDFEPYGRLSLPLAGVYQPRNAAVAITALEVLKSKGYKISNNDITEGVSAVYWPGRFEILSKNPVFILDGAHNPEAVELTADSIKLHFADKKITFVVGVMADKDVDLMMGLLAPVAKEFFTVKPDNPRAMDAETLAEHISRLGVPVTACRTVSSGVREAISSSGSDGIVCALGSLYFSGEIRAAAQELLVLR